MTGLAIRMPGADEFRRYAAWTIALLAIAASLTSITNGFALDDVHIIVENDRVHSLAIAWRVFIETYWPPWGGSSLYRPLTSLGFAIQWFIGGGSPLPFHILSIVLSALVSVAVLRFAESFLDWHVAWIAAALFAVHPLHVEAVANVVGQAELCAALLAVYAATRFVRADQQGDLSRREIGTISALYFAALMFKEHVVVLPALLVVINLTVGRNGRIAERVRRIGPLLVAMTLVAAVFIVIRTAVIGSIEGAGLSPLFVGQSFSARFFTMLRVIMEWIRLFFWPAELSADYSARRITIATSLDASMIPGAIVIPAVTLIALHVRRSLPGATLAIGWAGITLLIPSNLVVVTGFVLAERSLFFPSVGVVIGIAVLFDRMLHLAASEGRGRRWITAAIAVLLTFGIARSSLRNVVWRDNESLFFKTVEDAPTSARAHMMLATLYSDRGQMPKALEETTLALQLGSSNDRLLLAFAADMFQMGGKCHSAAPLYERSLAIEPDQAQVRLNAAICLTRIGEFEKARTTARGASASSRRDPRLEKIARLADSTLMRSAAGIPASSDSEDTN